MSGENDGGELSSPTSQDNQNAQDPSVEVVNKEDDSSENKSKETGSKSSSGSSSDDESNEKKEVVIEPAPIESPPADETSPETVTDKVEEVEVSPIVDPVDEKVEEVEVSPIVEPVDSSSQVPETPEVVEENITVRDLPLKDDFPTSSVDESVLLSTGVVEPSTHLDETGTVEHSDKKVYHILFFVSKYYLFSVFDHSKNFGL